MNNILNFPITTDAIDRSFSGNRLYVGDMFLDPWDVDTVETEPIEGSAIPVTNMFN